MQSSDLPQIEIHLEESTVKTVEWCSKAYLSIDRVLKYIKTVEKNIPADIVAFEPRMFLHNIFYSARSDMFSLTCDKKALETFLVSAISIQHYLLDLCCPRIDLLFKNYDRKDLLDLEKDMHDTVRSYDSIRKAHELWQKPTKNTLEKLSVWCDSIIVIDRRLHERAALLKLKPKVEVESIQSKRVFKIIVLIVGAIISLFSYSYRDVIKIFLNGLLQ